jgi:hypothetical protein
MSLESNYSKFEHNTYIRIIHFFCASTISVNKSFYTPDTFEKKKSKQQ